MLKEITIVDYGMGNLNSVKRKFNKIGVNAIISSNPTEILNAEKIVLPGVGHFQRAVDNLHKLELWEALNLAVLIKKTPILGICLGMQLMTKSSEEGNAYGLAWFDAEVLKFKINETLKYKIPHIGWNNVAVKKPNLLFKDVNLTAVFYFVHSYHVKCFNEKDVLTVTEYESTFVSAICRDNIWGVQFHPEKSHDAGEQLLTNFVSL